MQAPISTVAHSAERMVSTLPISGSIAAFAMWNSMTQPARINSPGLRNILEKRTGVFLALRTGAPPCASTGSISAGRT